MEVKSKKVLTHLSCSVPGQDCTVPLGARRLFLPSLCFVANKLGDVS